MSNESIYKKRLEIERRYEVAKKRALNMRNKELLFLMSQCPHTDAGWFNNGIDESDGCYRCTDCGKEWSAQQWREYKDASHE